MQKRAHLYSYTISYLHKFVYHISSFGSLFIYNIFTINNIFVEIIFTLPHLSCTHVKSEKIVKTLM